MKDHSVDIQLAWAQIHEDCIKLAKKLKNVKFKGIIAVARGGLIPASIIARELNIKRFEVLSIESYTDRKQDKHTLFHKPKVEKGEWLVIDELTDSGKTADFVRTIFPEFLIAVLYIKPDGKKGADYFVREYPQDSWLIFPWENEKLIKTTFND